MGRPLGIKPQPLLKHHWPIKLLPWVANREVPHALSLAACKKNNCADCHYDKAGAEIELGEKCGDEMENLEANGYTDSTGTYVVHCAH